jgi:hypothetical protein
MQNFQKHNKTKLNLLISLCPIESESFNQINVKLNIILFKFPCKIQNIRFVNLQFCLKAKYPKT